MPLPIPATAASVVVSAGQVGIGTSAPGAKLHSLSAGTSTPAAELHVAGGDVIIEL